MMFGKKQNKETGMPVYEPKPPVPDEKKRRWEFSTFNSNTMARDFINENGINPHTIITQPGGQVTIWYSAQK